MSEIAMAVGVFSALGAIPFGLGYGYSWLMQVFQAASDVQ